MKLKPYLEYKDSGLPWLGEIPAHWELPRLGTVLRERGEMNENGQVTQVLSVLKDVGVIPYEEKGNIGNKKSDDITRYKIVRPDDIVVNCMNIIIGSVGLSRHAGCLSPVYYVLTRRSKRDEPRYLNAFFQAKPFQQSLVRIGNGILAHRMRIPMELLKCEPFPRPPSEEQSVIVRFIDHAARHINRFIRTKRRLIELLNEQKQAIIHHAVTRGLNPNVRLKPSGVDWLGDVPEHWQAIRLKQTSKILRGKFSHRPRNDPDLYDGPYPFIQTGDVSRANRYIVSYSQTLNEKGLSVSKMFPSGTLVMTIAANIGDVAILTFDACFPDSVIGLIPSRLLQQNYLYYVLSCMKSELLKEAPVSTQGNLNVERVGASCIPVPPFGEQQQIVHAIEADTLDLDSAVSKTRREIDLIREYRTRLIADVVTGKLDVRGVALLVLGETEELEDWDEEMANEYANLDAASDDESMAQEENRE